MIAVLYVDDEESLLDLGKIFLEKTGNFTVEITTSPSDALQHLASGQYDAIISDYEMPGMNGIDLLKGVRQQFGNFPFILFTGRGREEVAIQAINNGADFYLQKGGDPRTQFAELEHIIRHAVSLRRAEESLLASVEGLREASSRYEALIAASNTGAWEYHSDSGFLWCSPEYFSMLGRDIHDFDFSGRRNVEETWIDLLHPDDREEAKRHFKTEKQNTERIYEQYFRMLHQDGHGVWIWSRGKTLCDTMGNPTPIMVGTHIDISKQIQAETELLRNNEELQAAYEEISATEEELRSNLNELNRQKLELQESKHELADIIDFLPDATLAIDLNGTVISWNRAIEEMTGISAEQMIGKSDYEYALPFYQQRRPIMVDLVLHDDLEVDAKYPTITRRGANLYSEIFIPHLNDGKGAHLWFTACPLYDTNGNLKGAIESIRDITDYKQAEKTLLEDEKHLEILVAFYQMASAPLQELMTFAIEKAVEITASSIGYLAFVNDDETMLTICAWSVQSMKECAIRKKKIQYPIDSTGLWGEAVRQRRPVITNDYAAPNPLKKGYPTDHVPIVRHMNIPVFEGTHIVMVAGVGNKTSWYDERDVRELSLLMNGLWNVITQKRAKKDLIQKNEELQAFNEELTATDEELRTMVEDLGRTEQELRSLNLYNRNLFETNPNPLVTITVDGTLTDVNTSTEQITGFSRDKLIGTHFSGYCTKPDQAQKVFFQTLADGTINDFPLFIRHRDGHITPVLFNATFYRDEKGDVAGVFAAARDITERKQAEEDLRVSEERYRDIFEKSVLGLFKTAPDGQVINANDAFAHMYGYRDAKDILNAGLKIKPFYADPNDRVKILQIIADKGIVESFETLHTKKDGTLFWVSITVRIIRDTDGTILFYEGTIINITERKLADYALKESEQKYRNVVEDQTEFISRFLPDGTHVFANDAYCRYFGKKKEEIIGHRFRPVLHPEDQEIVLHHLVSLTPQHPIMYINQRIIMPDGTTRWQRWSDRAIFDTNGNLLEYQSVGRDITRQKTAELALTLANKKLNLLSSITRHDINNQLTVLMGYLELLKDLNPNPSNKKYYQEITTAADLISSMIQFAKEYEEIGIHSPTWQDIHILVVYTEKEVLNRDVRAINGIPVGIEVFADPLIKRVFYNLMDNAIRYGGTITTIHFFSEEQEGCLKLVCEDDGEGVPTNEKEKIFKQGYGRNTGIGLFLSREILDITGITISESGETGKGARFEITVPKGVWRYAGRM